MAIKMYAAKSYFLNWRGRGFTGMQTYSRKRVFFEVWLPFGNVELVYWESHYLRKDYFVKKKSFIKRWPPAPPLRGFMKAYFFYCFFTTFCKKKTLPKAQRTRGFSSYHKFLHKSWSNFIFNLDQISVSQLKFDFKNLTNPTFRIPTKIQLQPNISSKILTRRSVVGLGNF